MDLSALYRLQCLQQKQEELKKRLVGLKECKELQRLKEEYHRLREELSEEEESLKKNSLQQELKNNELKNIQYNRKNCENIKFSRETDTVKKLENIEKQLEKLDEKKKAAENDIIKLIEAADNIKSSIEATKKKIVFIKRKYMSLKEATEKQIREETDAIEKLGIEIAGIINSTDKESLELYEKGKKTHKDPVALVTARICGGCNVEVPAMDYEALKGGNTLMRCQNCGRVLFKAVFAERQ